MTLVKVNAALSSALLLLLGLSPGVNGFCATLCPSKSLHQYGTHLFGYRQAYQYSLEKLMETGTIEINGVQISLDAASEKLNHDLRVSQEEEAQAKSRRSALETEMQSMEVQQSAVSLAMEEERKKQAADANEETEAKIEENGEKMRVIEDFNARESKLQTEMDFLAAKLRKEEENIRKHHEVSNRILQARIDLDVELGLLKKKYQEDSKKWEQDLKAEQEAHKTDLIQSQRQLDQLQNEIADLEMKARIAEMSGAQSEMLAAKLQNAQLMTNRILQKRIEIDGELTALKRKYEQDTKKWETTLQREMLNRDKEAAKVNAELERVKEEVAKMAAERNDFGSLLSRSLKVLFGGGE